MTKVLVLYYSMYGHIDTLAAAVAEGAKGGEGTRCTEKQRMGGERTERKAKEEGRRRERREKGRHDSFYPADRK